jgi:hypothetical protein
MDAQTAFEDLAELLVAAGCRRGKMMGRPMVAMGRRMVVFLREGSLGVRLVVGTSTHAEALRLPGAELFRPGRDRTFRDWVMIPYAHAERWPEFAFAAVERLTAE